MENEQDTQRWTAKRKSALVLSILRGEKNEKLKNCNTVSCKKSKFWLLRSLCSSLFYMIAPWRVKTQNPADAPRDGDLIFHLYNDCPDLFERVGEDIAADCPYLLERLAKAYEYDWDARNRDCGSCTLNHCPVKKGKVATAES